MTYDSLWHHKVSEHDPVFILLGNLLTDCVLITHQDILNYSRADTFKNLSTWLKDARQHLNQNSTILLVGNKCDLDAKRAVAKEEGKEFADANGLLYVETSSKTPLQC